MKYGIELDRNWRPGAEEDPKHVCDWMPVRLSVGVVAEYGSEENARTCALIWYPTAPTSFRIVLLPELSK